MSIPEGLSSADWETLLYVPFAVFFTVAYADGKLSPAETNTFAGIAKQIGTNAVRGPQDKLTRAIMQEASAVGSVAKRFDAAAGQGLTIAEVFANARLILEQRVDPDQAKVFVNTMVDLAEKIAEAWPLFSHASPEERNAIERIKAALGIASPAAPFVPFANNG
jgi:tellurite resistance protein